MDVEGTTTARVLTRERRVKGDFHYFLLVICSCIVLLTSMVIADRLFGIDYYDLVRDPNAIAGQPNYFGLVSNLGVILWFTGGIAALQAHWAGAGSDAPHLRRALLAGGLFSGLMGIDDLLMLHEAVATAGVPEPLVLVPHMLLLATLCYHAYFIRRAIQWNLLASAVASLGASFLVDAVSEHIAGLVFVEEGFKLLGIMFLAVFLSLTSHAALNMKHR
ncbi:hypothetical protein C7U60_03990 [Mesorhizobium plurifarium]|uniref:hypothetical protein n=1 Tax=Sinorhizobium arboris TaxID=76745 RepID=UPI000429E8A3|nr:hypothetical protein [Sinorhizobium arboris]PST26202.1 hypothetical protein C7U60_03990 [Mesorhizobium plurifarium]